MEWRPDPKLAVDLDPKVRPGVPMERPPRPAPGSRSPIEPQQSEVRVLRKAGPGPMPPVWGTAQPPSGLSGRVRTLAFRYPTHWARHWELLFLADRVQVWERRARWALPLAVGLLAAVRLARR